MNLLTLIDPAAVTDAATAPHLLLGAPRNLTIRCNFYYGSGGSQIDAWIQTSIDDGETWCDIAQFEVTDSRCAPRTISPPRRQRPARSSSPTARWRRTHPRMVCSARNCASNIPSPEIMWAPLSRSTSRPIN
jgi:hypothetical protein